MVVFHQRFSTNTLPQWRLAHPFRFLAHNGEINTIAGNRMWAQARRYKYQCEDLQDIDEIAPLVRAICAAVRGAKEIWLRTFPERML